VRSFGYGKPCATMRPDVDYSLLRKITCGLLGTAMGLLVSSAGFAGTDYGSGTPECRPSILFKSDSPMILLDKVRVRGTTVTVAGTALNEAYGTPERAWVGHLTLGLDDGPTFVAFATATHTAPIDLQILHAPAGVHRLRIRMISNAGIVNSAIDVCVSIPSSTTLDLKDIVQSLHRKN
jgi:hypothetical protein